jgi:hypothetical protein
MSTLVAQTLSNGTVSTSTANCIQGSAKAWVSYKGTTTRAINASYNVSSVTFNGTGDYTVNFTNALSDTNYCYVLGSRRETTGFGALVAVPASNSTKTTTAFQILTGSGTTALDTPEVCVTVFR